MSKSILKKHVKLAYESLSKSLQQPIYILKVQLEIMSASKHNVIDGVFKTFNMSLTPTQAFSTYMAVVFKVSPQSGSEPFTYTACYTE